MIVRGCANAGDVVPLIDAAALGVNVCNRPAAPPPPPGDVLEAPTWLGARVEGMSGRFGGHRYDVLGGALRVAAELYSTGVGGAGDSRTVGVFAGTFALGVYVEGTARTLPAELGGLGVGAGLTMRVPFIAAAGG